MHLGLDAAVAAAIGVAVIGGDDDRVLREVDARERARERVIGDRARRRGTRGLAPPCAWPAASTAPSSMHDEVGVAGDERGAGLARSRRATARSARRRTATRGSASGARTARDLGVGLSTRRRRASISSVDRGRRRRDRSSRGAEGAGTGAAARRSRSPSRRAGRRRARGPSANRARPASSDGSCARRSALGGTPVRIDT